MENWFSVKHKIYPSRPWETCSEIENRSNLTEKEALRVFRREPGWRFTAGVKFWLGRRNRPEVRTYFWCPEQSSKARRIRCENLSIIYWYYECHIYWAISSYSLNAKVREVENSSEMGTFSLGKIIFFGKLWFSRIYEALISIFWSLHQ